MKTFLHYSRQVTDDICPECWTSKKQARNVLKQLLDGPLLAFVKAKRCRIQLTFFD